jgi:hypothetical protein
MATRNPYEEEDETTHERPSSFREMLYRDRRIVSRREMDRLIRDRAAERGEESEITEEQATYFPALSRMFSGGTAAEIRAVALVIILVVTAFFFGRWVGQQEADDSPAQTAGVVTVA